jgi:hypothetical protein
LDAVPTVLNEQGFRFYFFSNERNEPPHVHARAGDAYAKVWLGPPMTLAESHDCSPRQLRAVLEVVTARRAIIEQAWHDYFGT